MPNPNDKSHRGNASQFYIAGELCRRGWVAVVTMGNCPNTDILCSNVAGTKFVHIQVKTFVPGNRTCTVGLKAAHNFGENFFWVLGGIPKPSQDVPFCYYVIPSPIMSAGIAEDYRHWIETPGRGGRPHSATNTIRAVTLPPKISATGWDVSVYANKWELIESRLN